MKKSDPMSGVLIESSPLKKEEDSEGDRVLMLAVLEDALGDYRRYLHTRRPRMKIYFQGIKTWLLSEDQGRFSFLDICRTLEIKPAYVRKLMRQWDKRPPAGDQESTKSFHFRRGLSKKSR